jgi:hypothetical protein
MGKSKFYFILGVTLAISVCVAHADNFTECRLEPVIPAGSSFATITATAKTRITFTDPGYSSTQPPLTVQTYPVKSNLPTFQNLRSGGSTRVTFTSLSVMLPEQLIERITVNTAIGILDIEPWFFSDESDRYYTEANDKFYTRKNYVKPKLPKQLLEWRAKISYLIPTQEYSVVRLAECQTHFERPYITDADIGKQLSIDEFNAMFPYVR